jgi:probable HAF family extracellular repeat protein
MFMGLGDLPGGSSYSVGRAISADGSTVVGLSSGTSGYEAYRWTIGGSMVGLGDLPGGSFVSSAYAVSADGSTIVGYSRGNFNEAFKWTSAGGMVGIGDFPTLPDSSHGGGISADGSAIIGYGSHEWTDPMDGKPSSAVEAFIWTSQGGMIGLGDIDLTLSAFHSKAQDISADGSTVVGYGMRAFSKYEAFMWTDAGGMIGLGGLPSGVPDVIISEAYGISADGSTIVGWGNNALDFREAFRWTSGEGMVGLGDLPGGLDASRAESVSADGSTIVGYSFSDSGKEAFIWDAANGMRELDALLETMGLDLSGWTLTTALDISDDGRVIVGFGTNPSGDTEGWIAVLNEPEAVPPLSPVGLAALCTLLGLAGLRRLRG